VISTVGCLLLPTFVALDALAGTYRWMLVAVLVGSLIGVFVGVALSRGGIAGAAALCQAAALGAVALGAILLFGAPGTPLGSSGTALGRTTFWLMSFAWMASGVFTLSGFLLRKVNPQS
jgi:hypothetical protein